MQLERRSSIQYKNKTKGIRQHMDQGNSDTLWSVIWFDWENKKNGRQVKKEMTYCETKLLGIWSKLV